jgi:hypothetical protein
LLWRHSAHHLPRVYVMPAILTLTYYVMLQLTLRPAWNRRARLLARREDYMQSIARRPSEQ